MAPSNSTPSDLYPSLTYGDAPAAIEWLCRAFGFTQRLVVPGPAGTIMHSELSLGGAVVMVNSSRPEAGRVAPPTDGPVHGALSIFVADPDAHYARARAADAKITQELKDEEYGARGYMATDPGGHQWYFANYRPGRWWGGESDLSGA